MRQPTQLWQLIISIVVVLGSCFASIINASNKIATIQKDLENVKTQQYNMQLASDKKYDKIDAKLDALQSDITTIRINLEKKADRQ